MQVSLKSPKPVEGTPSVFAGLPLLVHEGSLVIP